MKTTNRSTPLGKISIAFAVLGIIACACVALWVSAPAKVDTTRSLLINEVGVFRKTGDRYEIQNADGSWRVATDEETASFRKPEPRIKIDAKDWTVHTRNEGYRKLHPEEIERVNALGRAMTEAEWDAMQDDLQRIVPPPIPKAGENSVVVDGGNPNNGEAVPPINWGYSPNPEASAAFVAGLEAPTIREASPAMFIRGPPSEEKADVFLFRALNVAHQDRFGRDWRSIRQEIGDCVSHGWAHGVEVCSAVCYVEGETAEWWPVATESIYGGSRVEARGVSFGGWSDGSYGSAAAEWVSKWGVTFRRKYDGTGIDLATYSGQRAKQWGAYGNGGQGDNGKFDEVAKEFPVAGVTLVTSFDEAAAAISSGYPVPVCSMQGFASRRDDKGFARASGAWAHCMCFTSVRWNPPGLLCQNSWGPDWIDGPKYPDDMPDGSFWVEKPIVDRMLAGRDSFAVSRLKGFPHRPLDHKSWARRNPREAEPVFALAL